MLLVAMAMLVLLTAQARAEKTKLEGVVILNTATPDELRLIPGVGPARVRNILAYRRAHPFRTVDELARIKGIGRKTIRHWRMHLAVGGPSKKTYSGLPSRSLRVRLKILCSRQNWS